MSGHLDVKDGRLALGDVTPIRPRDRKYLRDTVAAYADIPIEPGESLPDAVCRYFGWPKPEDGAAP